VSVVNPIVAFYDIPGERERFSLCVIHKEGSSCGDINRLVKLVIILPDQGDSLKIALTGIVLIKERHALANADDVSRIPRGVFR
jgi:hypothetical protein